MNFLRTRLLAALVLLAGCATGEAVTTSSDPDDEMARIEITEVVVVDLDDEEASLDIWADPLERQYFATDTANDIVDRHIGAVFDGEQYLELTGINSARTSRDGINWVAQPTTGFDGVDDTRGLATSNGIYATVVWDFGTGQEAPRMLLATSTDFAAWTLRELLVDDEIRSSMYPIDIAMSGNNVAVLLGTDSPDIAALVFDGAVGSDLNRAVIPGEGSPASIVGVDGAFAIGMQVAGDTVPKTLVFTSPEPGVWEPTSPMPDNLSGELNSVGDSLVVTGWSQFDVEMFGAVSTDFGRSWERTEIDQGMRDVVPGAGGLASLSDGKLLFSRDGFDWVQIQAEPLVVDENSESFVEVHLVAIGENELIVSRFEDTTNSYIAIELSN